MHQAGGAVGATACEGVPTHTAAQQAKWLAFSLPPGKLSQSFTSFPGEAAGGDPESLLLPKPGPSSSMLASGKAPPGSSPCARTFAQEMAWLGLRPISGCSFPSSFFPPGQGAWPACHLPHLVRTHRAPWHMCKGGTRIPTPQHSGKCSRAASLAIARV